MFYLGCTLPNPADFCLLKSTSAKFYSFTETDEVLLQKIRPDIVGGPSIVITRKTVVNETSIRDSTNLCKIIVGIDASQLNPLSMCQAIPTGLCTRWEPISESGKFKPRQNKTTSSENMVMSYFHRVRPQCKAGSFYTTGTEKKMMYTVLMAFVDTATLCLQPWNLRPMSRSSFFGFKRKNLGKILTRES